MSRQPRRLRQLFITDYAEADYCFPSASFSPLFHWLPHCFSCPPLFLHSHYAFAAAASAGFRYFGCRHAFADADIADDFRHYCRWLAFAAADMPPMPPVR
jgi:hypothetical protein